MPSETPPSLPKRKRGAPLGNKNRYVHGAYARRPAPAPAHPSPPDRLSLSYDIGILRAYLHRTAMLGVLTCDLEQTQELLHTLSLAATALTRLIHTEAWLRQAIGDQVQPDSLPRIFSCMDTMTQCIRNLDSESSADQPTASQPTADQPTASQPAADQPTASQPTADQPTASQPAADQPTVSQPAPAEAEIDSRLDALLKKMSLDPALLASVLPVYPDPQRPSAPPVPGNGKLKPLKSPIGQ
jgi:hypothetical protein